MSLAHSTTHTSRHSQQDPSTSRIDWSQLHRFRKVPGGSEMPVEVLSAVRRIAPSSLADLSTPLCTEWCSTLTRNYLRDEFFRLVDAIPYGAPISSKESSLSESPVDPLVHFLTQGFSFERARGEGNLIYANSLQVVARGTFDPSTALDCLYDYPRTRRFIQATCAHLADLLDIFPNGEVRVVDAGCGPLPILAIAAALYSPRVRVVGIESNPVSAEIAQHVVHSFGLSPQIKIQHENAMSAKLKDPAHLIVSETMDTALKSESLVQIMENLRPQLASGGRVIPERVELLRAYARADALHTHSVSYRNLGRGLSVPHFHDLNYERVYRWDGYQPHTTLIKIPVVIRKEDFGPDSMPMVYLGTHVTMYAARDGKEEIKLLPSESQLTRPFYFYDKHAAWQWITLRRQSTDFGSRAPLEVFYVYPPGRAQHLSIICPELEFERYCPGGPAD